MNVLNAKIVILEAIRIANRRWMKGEKSLILKNWYARTAAKFPLKTVQNMERTLLNSNVNFVALLLNGFVGARHTSVNLVIKDKFKVIMCQN